MPAAYLREYCQYIENAGNPTAAQFDDDWEPIGKKLRFEMRQAGLIEERDDGKLYLMPVGVSFLHTP